MDLLTAGRFIKRKIGISIILKYERITQSFREAALYSQPILGENLPRQSEPRYMSINTRFHHGSTSYYYNVSQLCIDITTAGNIKNVTKWTIKRPPSVGPISFHCCFVNLMMGSGMFVALTVGLLGRTSRFDSCGLYCYIIGFLVLSLLDSTYIIYIRLYLEALQLGV